MTFCTLAFMRAMSARARRMAGMAMSPSITRMAIMSSLR